MKKKNNEPVYPKGTSTMYKTTIHDGKEIIYIRVGETSEYRFYSMKKIIET